MEDPPIIQPVARPQNGIRGGNAGQEAQPRSITLPEFDGVSWYLYAMRVEGELMTHNLWEVMSGALAQPALAGQAQQEWDRKSQLCRAALLKSLTNQQLALVARHRTAPEMWSALERRYSSDTVVKKDRLLEKILSFSKMKSGKIADHIASFEMLVEQYESLAVQAGLGLGQQQPQVLTDSLKRTVLTKSLSSSYQSFMQTLRARNLQYAGVVQALLDEADIQEGDKDEQAGDNSKALAITRAKKSSNPNSDQPKNSLICENCGKKGHRTADCWSKGNSEKGSGNKRGQTLGPAMGNKDKGSKGNLTCFFCHKSGHMLRNCLAMKKASEELRASPNASALVALTAHSKNASSHFDDDLDGWGH